MLIYMELSSPVQSSLWIMEWLKTDLSKLLQFYRKLFRLYATKLSFQSRKRKKERESLDWCIIMCGTEFRIHSCQYSPCLSHTDNGNSPGKFSSANLFSWNWKYPFSIGLLAYAWKLELIRWWFSDHMVNPCFLIEVERNSLELLSWVWE